jgi:pimeloyl-ACP methyl ester carboxylesterase
MNTLASDIPHATLVAALLAGGLCGCAVPPIQADRSAADSASQEMLQVQIHGDAALPTLIYLPGLHGDWTLVSSFRASVTNQFRFVEFTYPRNAEWSLDDYAAGIESALLTNGITHGWLVGESFGSQVAWAIVGRSQARADAASAMKLSADNAPMAVLPFTPDGVILAGGFVRHPLPWGVSWVKRATACTPQWGLKAGLWIYGRYARFRHRQAPETLACIREFVQRRQEPQDRLAIQHRLALIRENDPRPVARKTDLPVYALAGLVDPLVPNPWVRGWLKKHCPGYRGSRLIWRADHNVLGTAPRQSVEQVARWTEARKP